MTSKLKVGIVGASAQGSWGSRAHIPALAALDGFELSAVATTRQETADAAAQAFQVPLAFGDPRAMAEHPAIDIVSVCVRVPAHAEIVHAALAAGKHVYCEWPLGRDTAEAEQMLVGARARDVVHAIGLQARSSPLLRFVRDQIRNGMIGAVRSVGAAHSCDWMSRPPASMAYLQDVTSGAHFLSINGGHVSDTVTWLLGDFAGLASVTRTAMTDLTLADTGEHIVRSSPDQLAIAAILDSGAVASLRLSGASSPGTGIRLEISGDEGDLVIIAAPGSRGLQMADLRLFRTSGMGELTELEVPEHYFSAPAALRGTVALNVAEAYLALARKIAGEDSELPDFASAVSLHKTLDRITAAAVPASTSQC